MTQATVPSFHDLFSQAFQEGDPLAAQKQVEAANVRRLQTMYGDIARGDFQAFADALAEDIELEIVSGPGLPFNGLWRGRQEVVKATRENFAQIEEQRPVIQSIVAQGDTVVLCCREKGLYRATGKDYDVHWMLVVTYKDGKILRARELCADAAGS
jgi:ketosteroid isomerase-like protein